jgi:acetylornithine deacetylase/succinyl-diaminopimelate desuccinylase-like protein
MVPMTRRQLLAGTAAAALSARRAPAVPEWPNLAEAALAHLRAYLRINTSNPPGHVAEAVRFLAGVLEKEGIRSERFEMTPGKPNLVARLAGNGSKRPLLLLHHTDTVPADRARWQTDPWGAEIRLNRLWSRGAVDMKSAGVVHLMTFLLLARERVPLARDVIFAATADEEIGADAGVRFLLARHPEKVDAEYVLEEGGFSANRLFTEEGEVHAVSVAQKQVLWLRLTVEGTGGHGSQPTPDNAVAMLARALARISEAEPPRPEEPILAQMEQRLGTLASNRFAGAIRRNTISFTSLRAGVGEPPKENVIPSLAVATIDCRLLPAQSHAEFIEWVRKTAAEPKLKIEVVQHNASAAPSSIQTDLFRLIEATVARHSPQAKLTPYLTPFGTDGNWFRRPDRHVYGFFPVVISAEEATSMHSDAERIPVAPFEKGLRMFYEVVAGAVRAG